MILSPGVSSVSGIRSVLAPKEILMLVVTGQSLFETVYTPTAGDSEGTEEHGDLGGHESELDARVLAPLYSSSDRRFRKWEDVVLDSFACNNEDHITRVELAALHQERWDTGIRQMPCNQLNVGCVEAMAELARQIPSYVDAYSDVDNVIWADELETPWYRLFGGTLPGQIKDFKETEPAQRRSRGRVWWNARGFGGDGAGAGGARSGWFWTW